MMDGINLKVLNHTIFKQMMLFECKIILKKRWVHLGNPEVIIFLELAK